METMNPVSRNMAETKSCEIFRELQEINAIKVGEGNQNFLIKISDYCRGDSFLGAVYCTFS